MRKNDDVDTKVTSTVIAKVHGIATAAGCQLVATCDLAIAEKSTKFGVNGVNIGLFVLLQWSLFLEILQERKLLKC